MFHASEFTKKTTELGFNLYAGVPCSFLKPLINYVIDSRELGYMPMNNEGEAVAFACGAYLAGKKPIVMFQNSGLGNIVNPITSLAYPFRIPLLLISTWRGQPGVKDEPQHELMGKISAEMLSLMAADNAVVPAEAAGLDAVLSAAHGALKSRSLPYALVLPKGVVSAYELQSKPTKVSRLPGQIFPREDGASSAKRFEVLGAICEMVGDKHPIIATTGKTGRELFICRDSANHLYVVGSMGCAASIGLGLALNRNAGGKTIVIDGDGAALMRLEAMVSVGYYRPKNLIHIILDNNAHDSTGGQQTLSGGVAFDHVAYACGYSRAVSVSSLSRFASELQSGFETDGPLLLHMRIKSGSVEDLPRPDVPPHKVKERFMGYLGSPNPYA